MPPHGERTQSPVPIRTSAVTQSQSAAAAPHLGLVSYGGGYGVSGVVASPLHGRAQDISRQRIDGQRLCAVCGVSRDRVRRVHRGNRQTNLPSSHRKLRAARVPAHMRSLAPTNANGACGARWDPLACHALASGSAILRHPALSRVWPVLRECDYCAVLANGRQVCLLLPAGRSRTPRSRSRS